MCARSEARGRGLSRGRGHAIGWRHGCADLARRRALLARCTAAGRRWCSRTGSAAGSSSWWQQVPHFRKRFSCVVFSHRGFAPSRDASGLGPRRFVDDLEALLQHLHVDDVRLVGQSMGGWSCLGHALRRPEKVRGLVMACTTGQVTTPEIDAAINRLRGRATAAFMKGCTRRRAKRMVRDQPAMHELYRGMDVLGAADKRAIRDVLLGMRTVTARDLEGFTVPTLCDDVRRGLRVRAGLGGPPGAHAGRRALRQGARDRTLDLLGSARRCSISWSTSSSTRSSSATRCTQARRAELGALGGHCRSFVEAAPGAQKGFRNASGRGRSHGAMSDSPRSRRPREAGHGGVMYRLDIALSLVVSAHDGPSNRCGRHHAAGSRPGDVRDRGPCRSKHSGWSQASSPS